jgi:hypothetical protein
MGQHLGKNQREGDETELQKNVPATFHNVDLNAVELLWKTFKEGDSPHFVMEKNEVTNLFEKWQKTGSKLYSDVDSWFNSSQQVGKAPVATEDILLTITHYAHKINFRKHSDNSVQSSENDNENENDNNEKEEGETNKSKDVGINSTKEDSADEQMKTHEAECIDIMEMIFTILILSKATTKQKLRMMFNCANFDDESTKMDKDDILLPLKAFVSAAFIIYNLVMVDDDTIEAMCDQLYDSVCRVDLTGAKKLREGESKTPRENESKRKESKIPVMNDFSVERLLAWSNTEPVIESWLSPAAMRANRMETKDHDGDNDDEVDPDLLGEIYDIPLRSSEKTLAMDPDHMSGMNEDAMEAALANTTEGDMFMAVRPYIGTVKHLKPTPLEDKVFVASKDKTLARKKPTGGASDSAPHASLTLQHVHGYAGQKSRNNVFYLKHGENKGQIVYHVAGVGVVRSTDDAKKTHHQRYAFHHTDDILCMALGQRKNNNNNMEDIVATGEVGKTPKICVWSPTKNMGLIVSLRGFHQRGITQLCFSSPNDRDEHGTNQYLISIGLDDYHSVAVYDWNKNQLMYNARTSENKVLALSAHPRADWSKNDGNNVLFCTAGKQHLLFWKLKGRGIVSKTGTFGISHSKSKKNNSKSTIIVLCMDWLRDGTLLCGTSNGEILMWAKDTVNRNPDKMKPFRVRDIGAFERHTPSDYKAKKCAINILKVFQHGDNDFVVTGGQDGRVILYNDEKEVGGNYISSSDKNLNDQVNRHVLELYQYTNLYTQKGKQNNDNLSQDLLDCHIRALDFSVNGQDSKSWKLVIGTYGSDVIEFNLPEKSFDKAPDSTNGSTNEEEKHFDDCTIKSIVTRGHNKHELWGLAVHPKPEGANSFATVGDDGTLFMSMC